MNALHGSMVPLVPRSVPMQFVVFSELEPPYLWAQTDDGDTGGVFAEGETLAQLRKNVLRELRELKRMRLLRQNYGYVDIPKVAFRNESARDRGAIEFQAEELRKIQKSGHFTSVTFAPNGTILTVGGRRVSSTPKRLASPPILQRFAGTNRPS
jgi:hypothetical protein